MKHFNSVKYNKYFKRRYNLISSLLEILDSIICLITIGFYLSHFGFDYIISITDKVARQKLKELKDE